MRLMQLMAEIRGLARILIAALSHASYNLGRSYCMIQSICLQAP